MVEIINLNKSFKNKIIFKDFNYKFLDNNLYLISSFSGKGKTTLLNMIANIDKDYTGSINSDSDIFYLKLNYGLIDNFTVKENIELIKDIYGIKEVKLKYGIQEFIDKKVNKLSFGEKQRVIIYLALVVKCKCVLLDEPLAYLDINNQKEVIKDLNKLKKDKLVIIVSHDLLPFKDYIKVDLDNKKSIKSSCLINKINYRRIDSFKWAKILIKNNFKYFSLFIISIFMILFSLSSIKKEINYLKDGFNSSYSKGNLLYKDNYSNIEKDFYLDIQLPLIKESNYTYKSIYSIKMYEDKVFLEDKYLDNGFLFSLPMKNNYLNKGEVIVSLDIIEFCNNNGYSYCDFNIIKNNYLHKNLIYKNKDKVLTFKIKEILSGENAIYFSELENIEKVMTNLFKDYNFNYYISIKDQCLSNFYYKINHISSLLGYDFILVNKTKEESLFIINKAKHEYFNFNELTNNDLIGCNESIVSCSSFSLMQLKGLKQINNYKINEGVYFSKTNKPLTNEEIIISSLLSENLNLNKDDKISLEFLYNDQIYSKDFIIKDIIKSDNNVLYHHSNFTYELLPFYNIDNYRIEYGYGESLDYKKDNLLDSEIIQDSEAFLNDFINTLNTFIIILTFILLIFIFCLEIRKIRKNYKLFELLKVNKIENYLQINKCYYLLYFIIDIFILLIDYKFCLAYFIICLIFYYINKIKIQVALD